MTDIENSLNLHLCYRELKTHKLIQNNKFLTYKTTTQKGESGGALIIFR
jgi:hypothetical protein